MEISRQLYIEKIDGTCVRLEPILNLGPMSPAGTGINAVIVETIETTPDSGFWGVLATCTRFQVIIRPVG